MVGLLFSNDICSVLTFLSPLKPRPHPDTFISFLLISIWWQSIVTCSLGCFMESKVWVCLSGALGPPLHFLILVLWQRVLYRSVRRPLASLWSLCIQSLLYPSDPGSGCTLNNCAVFSHMLSQRAPPLWKFRAWFFSFRGYLTFPSRCTCSSSY